MDFNDMEHLALKNSSKKKTKLEMLLKQRSQKSMRKNLKKLQ